MKKKLSTHLYRFALSIMVSLIPVLCFSQGNSQKLLEDVKMESLNLSKQELSKVQHLSRDPLVSHVYALNIGSLSKIVESYNRSVSIKLPGDNNALVASTTKFEFSSDNNYHWSGEFKKGGGDISLVCKDGRFAGRITANHKIYEVRSLSKDKHLLVEYYAANFSADDGGKAKFDIEPIANPKLKSATTEDPVLIKILILYTDSCDIYYDRDMGSCIDLAMFQLQSALTSSLSNLQVNVVLADSAKTTYGESNYGVQLDLQWLDDNTSVAALRNSKHADLVVLMTHGWRNERGISWMGPNESTAFAVVRAPYITQTYTFTHEVGHLFGCKHQRTGFTDKGINHGYEFTGESGTHSTVMNTVTSSEESQRLNQFSNPEKFYEECSMGTWEYNNNALWIEQNASTVANFRTDPPPNYLTAFISGPTHGMIYGSYTWQADYSGGTGPYSCTWYKFYQYDYVQVETGWSYTTTLPNQGSMVYLKIIVTSSDNQQYISYYAVAIDQPEPILAGKDNHILNQVATRSNNSISIAEESLSNTISIFPNPMTDATVIQYLVKQISIVEIKVSDLSGKTIITLNEGTKEAGTYSKRLNTSNLSPGTYLCSVNIGDATIMKKLVIQ